VGFGNHSALNFSSRCAQFDDDVSFPFLRTSNHPRPLFHGFTNDALVVKFLRIVAVVLSSGVSSASRRQRCSTSRLRARLFAQHDVGKLFILVRPRALVHLSGVFASECSLREVTPSRESVFAVFFLDWTRAVVLTRSHRVCLDCGQIWGQIHPSRVLFHVAPRNFEDERSGATHEGASSRRPGLDDDENTTGSNLIPELANRYVQLTLISLDATAPSDARDAHWNFTEGVRGHYHIEAIASISAVETRARSHAFAFVPRMRRFESNGARRSSDPV
jgi:hypothetical protein